jgi:hypothetical protein
MPALGREKTTPFALPLRRLRVLPPPRRFSASVGCRHSGQGSEVIAAEPEADRLPLFQ